MRPIPPFELVAAALLGALVALLVRHVAARWLRRATAITRAKRARSGERKAEDLLRAHGYRIADRQLTTHYTLRCGRDEHAVELRADLIVVRDGKYFVAEVKTGSEAPSIESANTRRQLLEYRFAFDVHGVLLVDMEGLRVSEIVFPLPATAFRRERSRARSGVLLFVAVVFVVGILLVQYARTMPGR